MMKFHVVQRIVGQMKETLTAKETEKHHDVKLTAGKTYTVEMHSKQFDTFLRLHEVAGKKLAENDDIDFNAKNLNSRIVYTPKTSGTYRLIATSFQQRGRGEYAIIIRAIEPAKE